MRFRPRGLLLAVIAGLAAAGPAAGQEVPRGEYLRQMPLGLPTLVPATDANVALNLWGDPDDPGYADRDPVDGIDDRRHAVLEALAVRFAPYLVQNTTNIPVDFRVYPENRDVFTLTLDRWIRSGPEPELVDSAQVNVSALGRGACPDGGAEGALERTPGPTRDGVVEDCKLLELVNRFSPGSGELRARDADLVRTLPGRESVLYFNFPGSGEGSWEEAYRPEYERTSPARRPSFPHAFVHPFVREVPGTGGYELILQYWLFYPTNDSGMDHEGDWEHINAVITPLSRVRDALEADEVRAILDGSRALAGPDPLVLKRVDYYFHHFVQEVDFSRPNAYADRADWEAEADSMEEERYRQREIWEAIRYRVWVDDAETVINTHPFGYIGSDNKGLNQALEPPGGSNHNSHGTFPFPGRYNNVGPGGTNDQIGESVDHRRYLRRLAAGEVGTGPDFRNGRVVGLADRERLQIVPDWERVMAQVRADAGVRARWAWLVLPIRWGYPATVSPFSGVLENYNTGNVAPQGPAYNSGWNRSGESTGFVAYDPHTVPDIFPLAVQDNFRNDLGFLNLTVPLLFNLPPLDFATRVVAYPFRLALGRNDPVYYPADSIPFRFVGVSSGVSFQWLDEDFETLAINPAQYQEFGLRLIGHLVDNGFNEETTVVAAGSIRDDPSVGAFVQVPFYIGSRFVSENLVRNTRTPLGLAFSFSNIPDYVYRTELNYWEYAGSLRFNLLTGSFQPYAKVGYGWSWYRLENTTANGVSFDTPAISWIGPDGIWPNVVHYGAGLEWVPWRRIGTLPGGLEMALKVEFVRYQETLGLDLSSLELEQLGVFFPTLGDVPSNLGVHRHDLLLGLTVTF